MAIVRTHMNRKEIKSGTVVQDGKVMLFSLNDFLSKIVEGSNCFICGKSEKNVEFNDEHVIPDWILRRYRLHDKQITLPNRTLISYGQYKVPCCSACNAILGNLYEDPISKLLGQTYSEITKVIKSDTMSFSILFKWLSLIFFKIHLKSNSLRIKRDLRSESGTIGD